MAHDVQDKTVTSNSPSYPRGGGANAPGALTSASATIVQGESEAPAFSSSCPSGEGVKKSRQVMNRAEMKCFRRRLRSEGTPAEGALWKLLKCKQIAGLQFRRQFSVEHHILDFYCPFLKLAIELDGDYHYHMNMPDNDWHRDEELLQKYGIKTLRFENQIVFHHPEAIRYAILQELEARQSSDEVFSNA